MPAEDRPDNPPHHDLSRRGFLATVGAGTAGAMTLAGGCVFSGAAHADTISAIPRADRFGRMFPQLPPFVDATDRNRAALIDIGKPGGMMDAKDNLGVGPVQLITDPAQSVNNRDNPTHTAGVTPMLICRSWPTTASPWKTRPRSGTT